MTAEAYLKRVVGETCPSHSSIGICSLTPARHRFVRSSACRNGPAGLFDQANLTGHGLGSLEFNNHFLYFSEMRGGSPNLRPPGV